MCKTSPSGVISFTRKSVYLFEFVSTWNFDSGFHMRNPLKIVTMWHRTTRLHLQNRWCWYRSHDERRSRHTTQKHSRYCSCDRLCICDRSFSIPREILYGFWEVQSTVWAQVTLRFRREAEKGNCIQKRLLLAKPEYMWSGEQWRRSKSEMWKVEHYTSASRLQKILSWSCWRIAWYRLRFPSRAFWTSRLKSCWQRWWAQLRRNPPGG